MNQQTTTRTAGPAPAPTFSPAESSALRALRAQYQQHRDLFSARELARLRFQRWLYHTGRVGHARDQRRTDGLLAILLDEEQRHDR